jgi:hypothetical protein
MSWAASSGTKLVAGGGHQRAAGTALEEQRQHACTGRLSALAAEEEGDDAAAINSLRRRSGAACDGAAIVNLDPDYVRIKTRANPPLEGEYACGFGPQPAISPWWG